MKLLDRFREQVKSLGSLKRAWFTTFNLNIPFFETHILPALLDADAPINRMDYENMQMQITERAIDLRVFCDLRMMEADQPKRTALPVHGILPNRLGLEEYDEESLFHPKVIFLEDERGHMVLGAGSANLSIGGWGKNQEVFRFHRVSNNEQYQQIKRFFEPLMKVAVLDDDEEPALGIRRQFDGKDFDWRFVHSFERENFLHALLADTQAERLTAWSPYFSRDLAGLLQRIRNLAGGMLKFSIVPDRAGNQHVRAPWSEAIGRMLEEGVLAFHDPPLPRSEAIEMTHAKLWLATGPEKACLAVGSWNFTEPGCASFERRNVEAGIVLSVPPAAQIAGQPLNMGAAHFGSDEMLQEDELNPPPYPLPFDLQVRFDWKKRRYDVQGQLHGNIGDASYALHLPGLKQPLRLRWKDRRSGGAWPLEPIERELADNEPLLINHCYEVWRSDCLEYRGFVLETGQAHRRTQGYDSLKDLLNDLVDGTEPDDSRTPRLRAALRGDGAFDDQPAAPAPLAENGGLSYFRVFHAFDQFRKRLLETTSRADLEKLLFVRAGSLQELVAKANEHAAAPGGSAIFNWFLLQETASLHALALQVYDRTRERYERKVPPQSAKWRSLRPNGKAARLPKEIRENSAYMRKLREVCDYGG